MERSFFLQLVTRLVPAATAAFAVLMLFPPGAFAVEGTSTPPMLKGDFRVGYQGGIGLIGLEDRSGGDDYFLDVGRFTEIEQGMRLEGSFAAYHGIAVRVGLPLTFYSARHWDSANDFIFDPASGGPSMVGGQALESSVLDASGSSRTHAGPGEFEIGFRVVPFAQVGVPGRVAPASLAIDFDVAAPSGGNHDTLREDETAGPGTGGPEVRLRMTGSRRFGNVEPYVAIGFIHRAAYRVDLEGVRAVPSSDSDEEGLTELKPADEFSLRFGGEMIAVEDVDADTGVRFLMGVGMTYVGPNEVSSGTLLPAPLAATVGHRARSAEHLEIDLSMGLRARTKADGEFFFDFGTTWLSPHSLELVSENAYGVRTAGPSFRLHWSLGATVRFR
jgi:hypothetical protein